MISYRFIGALAVCLTVPQIGFSAADMKIRDLSVIQTGAISNLFVTNTITVGGIVINPAATNGPFIASMNGNATNTVVWATNGNPGRGFMIRNTNNASMFIAPYAYGWGIFGNPGDTISPENDWFEFFCPRLGFSIRANYTNTSVNPQFLLRNRLDTLELGLKMPVDTDFTNGWGEISVGNRAGATPTNSLGIKFYGNKSTGESYVGRYDGDTLAWHMEGSVNVYGAHTTEANYQRIVLACDTSQAKLYSESSVASQIPLSLGSAGTLRWDINTSGHLMAHADNTYDIGAIGATRPRSVYIGTNLLVSASSLSVTSGYVGIGITTPIKDLVINNPTGASVFVKLTSTSTGTGLNDGFDISDQFADAYLIQWENAPIHFYTAGTERMNITGGGAASFLGSVGVNGLTTFTNTVNATSNLWVKAGQGASNAWVGGKLFSDTTSYTNLNGTGTMSNLATVSIVGNTLTNTGDTIRAIWGVKLPSDLANTNQFQIVYGGTTILDTGLQSASNCSFTVEVVIMRTGNSAQHCEGKLYWGPLGVPFQFTNSNIEATENNGIANTLALKGGARRVGAHTNNSMRVYYDFGLR